MTTSDSFQTSQAVKAVIAETRNRLPHFNDLVQGRPAFYDINREYEPIFQQIYAKMPPEKLAKPWIALLYSYDAPQRKSMQCRTFRIYRSLRENYVQVALDVGYVTTNLLMSFITNDADTVDRLAEKVRMKINWDFTTEFDDLMWLPWTPNVSYTIGNVIRPTTYNGHLYICVKAGTSSQVEPDWSNTQETYSETTHVVWKQIEPSKLKVRAYDFIASTITQDNLLESGIRYKFDFGCTLFYPIISDTNDTIYTIKQADLTIREQDSSVSLDSIHVV